MITELGGKSTNRMETSSVETVREAVRIQHDREATIDEKEIASQTIVDMLDYYTDGWFSSREMD